LPESHPTAIILGAHVGFTGELLRWQRCEGRERLRGGGGTKVFPHRPNAFFYGTFRKIYLLHLP
jgi:hypothetical protein